MKTKKIVAAILLTIVFSCIGFIIVKNSAVNKISVTDFKSDEKIMYYDIKGTAQYDIRGNRFEQSGNDPQIYVNGFKLDLTSMRIAFEEPLENDMPIQVYYAPQNGKTYEESSVVKFCYKGDTEAYIDVEDVKNCNNLRIDIDGNFVLDVIELSESDFVIKDDGKYHISAAAYVVMFMLAAGLSYLLVFVWKIIEKLNDKILSVKNINFKNITEKKNIYKIAVSIIYVGLMLIFCIQGNENRYVFAVWLAALTVTFIILVNVFSLKNRIAGVTALIIFVTGLCYIFTLPAATLVSADDEIHYQNSVYLSHAFDKKVTEADEYIYNRRVVPVYKTEKITEMKEKLETLYEQGGVNREVSMTMNSYKSISYVPSAVGMFVARGLNCSFENVFYAGKIGNLLMYSILIYFAIRRIKSGKLIIAVIALLPTNIFLAASYTYDIWLTGFSILAVSYIIGVIQDRDENVFIKWSDMAVILSGFVLGFAPKAVYFPLMLLILLIPKESFKNRKNYRTFLIASFICMMLVLFTFMLPFVVKGPGTGDMRGGSGVNSSEQVMFILENPVEYTKILLNHIKGYVSPEVQNETLGKYMYMGNSTHFILIVFILTAAVFFDRSKRDEGLNNIKSRIWTILSIFASIVLVSTAMYVSFTPVGNSVINGCQHRYLIPLIFPALYFILNIKVDNRANKNVFYTMALAGMAFILYSDAWKLWVSLYQM